MLPEEPLLVLGVVDWSWVLELPDILPPLDELPLG